MRAAVAPSKHAAEGGATFALVEARHVRREDPVQFLLLKNSYDLSFEDRMWLIDRMRIVNASMLRDRSVLVPNQ